MSASATLKSSDAFRQKAPEHRPTSPRPAAPSGGLPVLVGLGGKGILEAKGHVQLLVLDAQLAKDRLRGRPRGRRPVQKTSAHLMESPVHRAEARPAPGLTVKSIV